MTKRAKIFVMAVVIALTPMSIGCVPKTSNPYTGGSYERTLAEKSIDSVRILLTQANDTLYQLIDNDRISESEARTTQTVLVTISGYLNDADANIVSGNSQKASELVADAITALGPVIERIGAMRLEE